MYDLAGYVAREERGTVPVAFAGATVEDFPLIREIKDWMLAPSSGLVIVGPVGVGKTHLAAAIANASRDIEFWECEMLVDVARKQSSNAYDNNVYGSHPIIERLAGRELPIVLDDMTAVRPTEFALDAIGQVVRRRSHRALPTIVTMHSDEGELAGIYGEAIASRVVGFGPIVKLFGSDRRRGLRDCTEVPSKAAKQEEEANETGLSGDRSTRIRNQVTNRRRNT